MISGEPGNEAPHTAAPDRTRFQDDTAGFWGFTDIDVLVVCPACDEPAVVRVVERDEEHPGRSARELVCARCLTRRRGGSVLLVRGGPRDPYLHERLWLQTSCSGHVLWAFNEAHVDYLRRLVRAKLRENAPGSRVVENYSGRLPRWILDRKHRDEVLTALDRLDEKAAEHRRRR